MVAMLLATLFAGAGLLALGTMIASWLCFGFRFRELREELARTQDGRPVRFTWRATGARSTAVIYNLDFKAKADGLPYHPQRKPELRAAA